MPRTLGGGWSSYLLDLFRQGTKRFFLGQPLSTEVQLEHRLPVFLALPVFASDAISSVAYGTQEILIVLAAVAVAPGISAAGYLMPISIAIAILMLIVATSYRRAVYLYPTSGGSYTVTKNNLGAYTGLVAAAALLIDYVMTVAVSVSSGVDALTSAFNSLAPYNVSLALLLVAIITLVNMRGTKESGFTFALPMYTFVFMGVMLVMSSVYHFITRTVHPVPLPEHAILPTTGLTLGIFIILKAFAHGCTSMTGTEAISNGVSAFQPPESKHAAQTLSIMIGTLMFLFLGVSFAASIYHTIPSEGGETILSQLATVNFGRVPTQMTGIVTILLYIIRHPQTIFYYVLQFSTTLILMVAANTSFADFPRLMAFVARDSYAPKAFITLGDRLVYTRGIIALALVSAVLIYFYQANVNNLLGLYAVGVFLCFTLSQLGMAKRIRETRPKGWQSAVAINLTGAIVTGIVTGVTLVTKFNAGAKWVAVLVPVLVFICIIIRRHYRWFDRTMTIQSTDHNPLKEPVKPLTVLVLVSSDVHRGILEGLECGRAISEGKPDSILRAVHIEMDPEKTPRLLQRWEELVQPYIGQEIRLDIVPSPYRWLVEPIMEYVDQVDRERLDHRVFIVLPEFETGSVITHFLHNFTARRLRAALMNRPHVTVVSSRFFMQPLAWRRGRGGLVY